MFRVQARPPLPTHNTMRPHLVLYAPSGGNMAYQCHWKREQIQRLSCPEREHISHVVTALFVIYSDMYPFSKLPLALEYLPIGFHIINTWFDLRGKSQRDHTGSLCFEDEECEAVHTRLYTSYRNNDSVEIWHTCAILYRNLYIKRPMNLQNNK